MVAVGGASPIAVAVPPGTVDGQAVEVAIRPENLQLAALSPGAPPLAGTAPGKVAEVTFLGNLVDCHVVLDDGTRVRVQAPASSAFETGQRVGVTFDADAATVFGATLPA
jgi:ABC-type Fe3+/spermidine/putrescine transport system ATPase subunit